MKRYVVLRYFIDTLEDDDIAIFIGPTICKEAYQYDRPTNFYMEDSHGYGLSVALGLAMGTKRKVFVFMGEGDLLRQMSVLLQMKASLCSNIFMVLLDNKVYQDGCKLPNIMETVRSKMSLMFNLGLVVYNFNLYFNKKEFKKMKKFMKSIKGPMVILIDVDLGIKRELSEIDITLSNMIDRLQKELAKEDLEVPISEISSVLRVEDVKDFSELGGN